jgi:dTDP-4-dehydrorhamnose 3,5-epimerase-like enzyme
MPDTYEPPFEQYATPVDVDEAAPHLEPRLDPLEARIRALFGPDAPHPGTGSMPWPAAARMGVLPRAAVMAKDESTRCVTVEVVGLHQDHRGCVFEPLDPERLPGQRHVHVVVTGPRGVRGNHYHARSTEVLTVQGLALVRLRDARGVWDTCVAAGAVTRVTIPPGVAHAIQNLGTRPTVLTAFRDCAHDPADLDVIREVLIEG